MEERDDPATQGATAARHSALLGDALALAQELGANKPLVVREVLATGTVQGQDKALNSKTASVSYRAERYKRTWHTLVPWEYLEHTTVAEEAESMIDTVEANILMTETNSWPSPPSLPGDGQC